ncbi:hypothetical protein B0H15DRAFT_497573 [Mycena belliarum]|uniref:Uncharacterized protein n=1 Tax=Mycena belliarum TaxID=1033014 RepID=A0AAD6XPW2_9AGAR|nr:hypothetical protein B0H15DRAFT_497573 [Mycena belliae]
MSWRATTGSLSWEVILLTLHRYKNPTHAIIRSEIDSVKRTLELRSHSLLLETPAGERFLLSLRTGNEFYDWQDEMYYSRLKGVKALSRNSKRNEHYGPIWAHFRRPSDPAGSAIQLVQPKQTWPHHVKKKSNLSPLSSPSSPDDFPVMLMASNEPC